MTADPKKTPEITKKIQGISQQIQTHESVVRRLEGEKNVRMHQIDQQIQTHESIVRRLEGEKNSRMLQYDQEIEQEKQQIKQLNDQIAGLKRKP
jgi:chromosome segregation ATPase